MEYSNNVNIKAECMAMCPQSEIELREKQGLLHILEVIPNPDKKTKPKADKNKMVKEFSRSAAGKKLLNPKNLRPPLILLKTVNYLLEEIILNEKITWNIKYNFIMDRLRSVRQDMVIQSTSVAETICLLQPIIKFYAYSAYHSCEEPIQNFDPYINETHLQECLKRLLCMYDECEIMMAREDQKYNYCINKLKEIRPEFEAMYIILNLGNNTALRRALTLNNTCKTEIVQLSSLMSLNYINNNFVKIGRIFQKLPLILQCIASLHFPQIRRNALKIMSIAYNNKNFTFPLSVLTELLNYNNVEEAKKDCNYYGLKCTDEDTVQFIKNDFDHSKKLLKPTRINKLDHKFLQIKLDEFLLAC